MAIDYCEKFLPDLPAFREKIAAFDKKEVTVNEYKGFSGGFGSYAQRGAERHMLRLRMTGGRLTKERLAGIVEMIQNYDVPFAKLTTCECVQLHDLKADIVPDLMEIAWKHNMITRGGGGDFPRNIMMTPLSGVDPAETFDVLPYAEAAGQYLMSFIDGPKFPRKLKVCFSNTAENVPHATFRDMGFIAQADGTFTLYVAGGLGNNPLMGAKVADGIDPTKICYYIKAFVETFKELGNYTNRGRARTRYMQMDHGTDVMLACMNKHLEEAFAGEDLTINPAPYVVEKPSFRDIFRAPRVTEQKQAGLYAVKYQPIGGHWEPEKIVEIYETIKDMEQVEIRVTPEESIYIINLNSQEAKEVLAVTEDGAQNLFETSVACIGAKTCQVGIGDSQGLLKACVARVRQENFADGVLPQIHISGCPSSCGTHQAGTIGFRGGKKPTANGPVDAFAIAVGGCALQGQENLAQPGMKAIIATEIPEFLVDLGKMIAAEDTTYAEWIKTNGDKLQALIDKYTA